MLYLAFKYDVWGLKTVTPSSSENQEGSDTSSGQEAIDKAKEAKEKTEEKQRETQERIEEQERQESGQ